MEVNGDIMFLLVYKAKNLKVELQNLNKKEFWNISEWVKASTEKLASAQSHLSHDLNNEALGPIEIDLMSKFISLSKMEENLSKQKSRIDFFFSVIKLILTKKDLQKENTMRKLVRLSMIIKR